MNEKFPIGRVVLIHDPQLARSLGREGEAAVVMQRRRGSARVGFLRDGGNAWVEDHRLYALESAPPGELLLDAVSFALGCIQAEDVEIENLEQGRVELNVRCLAFEGAELRALREGLGDRLLAWKVVPYGMAALVVVLDIGGG